MKRGEIWTVASGSDYTSKPRPVVILQNERFANLDSIAICSCTSSTSAIPKRAPPISILQTSSRSMIVHSGDSGDKSIEYELHVRRCEINDMTTKGRRSDSSGMARYSAGRR